MASLPANFNKVAQGRVKNQPRPLIKPDYSSIRHPSTIKLLSVVKTPVIHSIVDEQGVGLSKGELLPFIMDPFWFRIRLAMLIMFGLTFFVMLISAGVVIVMTPACVLHSNGSSTSFDSI